MSTTLTESTTVRFLGRCRECKRPNRLDVENSVQTQKLVTCKCGKTVKLQRVFGWYSPDVKCNARCTGAVGPSCDCSCGGANHGANWGI